MNHSGTEFDNILIKRLTDDYVVTGFAYSRLRGDEYQCIYSNLHCNIYPKPTLILKELGFEISGGELKSYIIYQDNKFNKRYYIDYNRYKYLLDLLYNNVLYSGGITNKLHLEFINRIKLYLI